LESVANAHTAADLHVRPVPLTALVSRAAGAANALRDTACLISRNENDSTLPRLKTSSPRQTSQSVRRHWQRFESVYRFETSSDCDISDNGAK